MIKEDYYLICLLRRLAPSSEVLLAARRGVENMNEEAQRMLVQRAPAALLHLLFYSLLTRVFRDFS